MLGLTKVQLLVLSQVSEGDAAHLGTVCRQLHVERALAANVMQQLTSMELLNQENSELFSITEKGIEALKEFGCKALIVEDELSRTVLEHLVIKTIARKKAPKQTPCLYVARELGIVPQKTELMTFMRKMAARGVIRHREDNGCFTLNTNVPATVKEDLVPANETDSASAITQFPVTPAAEISPATLPAAIESALTTLGQQIQFPPQIVIADLPVKQQVLARLGALMEDSIAAVLEQISADLTNVAQLNHK